LDQKFRQAKNKDWGIGGGGGDGNIVDRAQRFLSPLSKHGRKRGSD